MDMLFLMADRKTGLPDEKLEVCGRATAAANMAKKFQRYLPEAHSRLL
jgi:hypothetical protein